MLLNALRHAATQRSVLDIHTNRSNSPTRMTVVSVDEDEGYVYGYLSSTPDYLSRIEIRQIVLASPVA